jgi:hypothetical protein
VTLDEHDQPAFPLPAAIEHAFQHSALKDYREDEVVEMLGVSLRWLQYQRERGLPPPFYRPNGAALVRYPHDALMDWRRGEVARSMAEAKAAYGRKASKSQGKTVSIRRPSTAADEIMGVPLGDPDIHGLDEPVVRGGRPRKMPATFADFLTSTDPDDEWLFALRGITQRPVDFLGMVERGEERQADEGLVWLTMDGRVEMMRVALEREAHAKLAATRLQALEARATTAGKPEGRG